MVWRVIAHVYNLDEFEPTLVRPENVISPQAEDSDLSDLCPSLQVSEPAAFSEVPDQVNKTDLHKEVHQALAPRAPGVV